MDPELNKDFFPAVHSETFLASKIISSKTAVFRTENYDILVKIVCSVCATGENVCSKKDLKTHHK